MTEKPRVAQGRAQFREKNRSEFAIRKKAVIEISIRGLSGHLLKRRMFSNLARFLFLYSFQICDSSLKISFRNSIKLKKKQRSFAFLVYISPVKTQSAQKLVLISKWIFFRARWTNVLYRQPCR